MPSSSSSSNALDLAPQTSLPPPSPSPPPPPLLHCMSLENYPNIDETQVYNDLTYNEFVAAASQHRVEEENKNQNEV